MKRIDPIVWRETRYIALTVAAGSLLIQGVCLIAGWWSPPVLLGNLLGGITAIGNTLLVGLMVQQAVAQEEKKAKSTVRLSQGGRLLLQGLILVLAAVLPRIFNIWTTALPLLIPRIAVSFRAGRIKNGEPRSVAAEDPDDDPYDDDAD